MLVRYEQEKTVLDEALTTNTGGSVSATDIFDSIEALYNLPYTGKQIKQMQMLMVRNQAGEHGNTEVVLEENRQARQVKQRQRNQKHNKNKQNENRNVGVNQKAQPSMKAKNRRPDNNSGPKNFPNANMYQQNIRNPQGYGHSNFHNSPYPGNMHDQRHSGGFPPQFGQHQPAGQFRAYQENLGNPAFNPQGRPPPLMSLPPPMFFGHQHNPEMLNYQRQNNFPNHLNSNFSGYGQFGGGAPNNFQAQAGGTKDPDFDDWLKNVLGDNANTSGTQKNSTNDGYFRQYNDLRKEESSEEESSDDDLSDSKISNDSDDDEEFKEFMKQNNLEYLVKALANDDVNRNKPRRKRSKGKKFSNQSRNTTQQNSNVEDDVPDNKSKQKKGFIGNLFNLF